MGYLALIEEMDSNFFFGIACQCNDSVFIWLQITVTPLTVVGCLMSHVQPDTLGIVYWPGDGAWCLRL